LTEESEHYYVKLLAETEAEVEALTAQVRDHPCVHGHLGCSTMDRGACFDASLAELEARIKKLVGTPAGSEEGG
jgi:hypothetical protein